MEGELLMEDEFFSGGKRLVEAEVFVKDELWVKDEVLVFFCRM